MWGTRSGGRLRTWMCAVELSRDVPAKPVRADGTGAPHGKELAPSAAEPTSPTATTPRNASYFPASTQNGARNRFLLIFPAAVRPRSSTNRTSFGHL